MPYHKKKEIVALGTQLQYWEILKHKPTLNGTGPSSHKDSVNHGDSEGQCKFKRRIESLAKRHCCLIA